MKMTEDDEGTDSEEQFNAATKEVYSKRLFVNINRNRQCMVAIATLQNA